MKALGMIEVYGYLTAVEALDSALKAANVSLVDVVKVRGGLVSVLITGDVGAVKAAVDASQAAAERVGRIISVHVIPRPAEDVEKMLKRSPTDEKPTPPDSSKGVAPTEPEPDISQVVSEANKEAEKEEKVPEQEQVTIEQMREMTVSALRSLARQLKIDTMSRQEIRFAKKQELIHGILKFLGQEN